MLVVLHFGGGISVFICDVVGRGGQLQMLQYGTIGSQGCRLSATLLPDAASSLQTVQKININYESIPSGGAVITAPGTVVGLIASPSHSSVKWFHC